SMPRIPKSATCTPSGYCRFINRRATSTPKPSSPRKILPIHAIRMRFVLRSDDVSFTGPFMAYPLHLPAVPPPLERRRTYGQVGALHLSAYVPRLDHHLP